MDAMSSIVVMAGLALGSLFLVFFTVFQLHGETVHVARLATDVVSSNPQWLEAALNYTGRQANESNILIDSFMQQVSFGLVIGLPFHDQQLLLSQ